ncbi:SO_0444 family Cu/Zn efflux transporter [candidate division KSB3 bacterium]|uniref:SO_0444 family Cu/Zn efflux transporter n=1 Tax=candidate division KSB3 bacterium TaxID=2044937 RepID=A0A9D5JWY1_9BACT|nr:SO_0444 family Cu/Zn efflux transporter [candidate division KSB3 bacterium]MBD3325817.1 SO_0444 family Cu/Zn efflux transporter [candidate division KSB3 bacterium]
MSVIAPYIILYLSACWEIFVEMAPYICLGFLMAGLIHVFVETQTIFTYLGKGRIKSVIYAALIGIPLPLCSCSVVPTTAGLKKQGANNGAAMSFLIATPETGVDSIAVTYALLDPIMTIFRPIAAFLTAVVAGISENLWGNAYQEPEERISSERSCSVDNCCDDSDCASETQQRPRTLLKKLAAALQYGFGTIVHDIGKWLIIGVAVAGAISVIIPEDLLRSHLPGGIFSMLIMLLVGIPFYICATASTPIAAALILKGVSPGAAFVLLLAGPATNAATISVIYGVFRRRATIIYLSSIAICAIGMGLLLDQIYSWWQIPTSAVAGTATELLPEWLSLMTAVLLLAVLLYDAANGWWQRRHRPAASCDSRSCSCH